MASRSTLDIFQFVHPEQVEPEEQTGGRPLARVSNGPGPALNAMHMLALVDPGAAERPSASSRSATQLLELLPRQGRSSKQKRRCLQVLNRQSRERRSAQRLAVQARKFNLSGRAVIADEFMVMPGGGHFGTQKSQDRANGKAGPRRPCSGRPSQGVL